MTPTPAASIGPAVAVLDTNAVLYAWLFDAPAARPLRLAIESSRLRWEATEPMLDELASVLARPIGQRWEGRREAMRAIDWQRWVRRVAVPPPCGAGWRCADPDDQKFLDLALHARTAWLITRDRALLRFRRRARDLGVSIVGPEGWQASPEHEPNHPEDIGATPPTGDVASQTSDRPPGLPRSAREGSPGSATGRKERGAAAAAPLQRPGGSP